jgi:tetratricopeptide (TPR) repeat protein
VSAQVCQLAVLIAALLPPAWAAAATPAPPATAVAEEAAEHARRAGRENRHAEAIAAWGRALQAQPQRREDWLLEFADQHTWVGRLDEAIALYREALAVRDPARQQQARLGLARALAWAGRHREALQVYDAALTYAPRDREAQLGRARVLSWTDRQAEALRQFEQALRDHPGDADALRGIGRVQSWRGRQREAAATLRGFLQVRPHDREATLALAESLAWMGRTDHAMAVLRAQAQADPGDARSAALRQKLERELQPVTSLDVRDYDQSDDLRISEVTLSLRQPMAQGRGHVAARYADASYRPPAGRAADLRVRRPGAEARYRFSDALEWNGSLSLDLIEARSRLGELRRWTHDTYLTWWPSDLWRLDLSSARWTFDSEESLRQGLTATQLKLSADWLPDELTRVSMRLHRARHSDANRREGGQIEAERRIWHRPRVNLGYRHTGYGFTTPGQRGYFNPDTYRSDEVWLQAGGWTQAGIGWNLRWMLGRERSQPGDTRPIRGASASVSWEVDDKFVIEAAYDFSTSRTLSTGGFQRGVGRLGLRVRH